MLLRGYVVTLSPTTGTRINEEFYYTMFPINSPKRGHIEKEWIYLTSGYAIIVPTLVGAIADVMKPYYIHIDEATPVDNYRPSKISWESSTDARDQHPFKFHRILFAQDSHGNAIDYKLDQEKHYRFNWAAQYYTDKRGRIYEF